MRLHQMNAAGQSSSDARSTVVSSSANSTNPFAYHKALAQEHVRSLPALISLALIKLVFCSVPVSRQLAAA